MRSLFFIFFVVFLNSAASHADEKAYLKVGEAKTKKTVIALPAPFLKNGTSLKNASNSVVKILKDDLLFVDLFQFLPEEAFPSEAAKASGSLDVVKFAEWSTSGTEMLLKTSLATEEKNLVLEAYLYDTFRGRQLFAKRYIGGPTDTATLAHTLANEVVKTLTGSTGIFLTKIAMSCDQTGKKEIYIMNFDGTDVKKITHHKSIAFAPAWSPDASKIVYSLYTRHTSNVKNIDLYEFDFKTNALTLLSNRNGINSGAAYQPDGKSIALTMSFLGNPEIFALDPITKQATRLTKSFGFDVDPSWSPDGTKLAFVSSRAGNPMVFSMTAGGDSPQRLTFAGKYNATPSWSPTNNKIAFAGWKDGHFEIFIMNPDGTKIDRLTQGQGNNEDPHFSPDGNFIVFSSNRTGSKNVYVMNLDGSSVKRLTYGLGNCVAPKWSK